ncbi:MAG: YraN family protein [Candidatus Aminicenantes bacterium]|nr:YraN family protein [Candidatus Aminicenantes bacterium]
MEKDKIGSFPFGLWGEELAANYLQNKGYEILQKHFYFHHTEIDLIARDGNYLVFVEVKTRSSADFGRPEESLTERKKHYLRRAAEGYLYLNNLYHLDCRFDVISISFDQFNQPLIEHLENAFE